MKRLLKSFDNGTLVILAITLILFVVAVFEKGMTHDLLLEAGVFLVSVKLMMLSYKATVSGQALSRDLAEIKAMLRDAAARQLAEGGEAPAGPRESPPLDRSA